MQILAHAGANWNPNALDVHPHTGQTAIGVGRTVLLYTVDGRFSGELRTTGRGLVLSVSYGRDKGVSHLLVVATSERNVRLFDVEARRIARSVNESAFKEINGSVIYAGFLRGAPYLVLIVFDTGAYIVMDLQGPSSLVVERCSLPLHRVRTVVDMAVPLRTVFIAGIHGLSGAVYSLSFDDYSAKRCFEKRTMYSGIAFHDMAAEPLASKDSQETFRVAFIFEGRIEPVIFRALDAMAPWTPHIEKALADVKKLSPTSKQTPKDLHVCCSWLNSRDIVTSDARGTLTMWRVSSNDRATLLCRRSAAHIRQIFAIKPHAQGRQCVTISMDRTTATWRLTGCSRDSPELLLCWRTLRSNGPIRALSSVTYDDKTVIAYTSAAGAIIEFALNQGFTQVIGETVPVGNVLGKRSRVTIDILHSLRSSISKPQTALYHLCDGTAGVIVQRDDELQCIPCKWTRKANSKKRRRDWSGNGNGACGSIWPVHGALASQDRDGALIVWSPSGDYAKESGDHCKLEPSLLTLHNARVSVVCSLDVGYIFGNENGNIYSCINGRCVPITSCHTLSCVTSVAVDDVTLAIAIADCNGLLLSAKLSEHIKLATDKLPNFEMLSPSLIKLSIDRAVVKMAWSSGSAAEEHCQTPIDNPNISKFPDKRLVTIHKNNEVIVWQLRGSELFEQSHIKEHSGSVNDIAWVDSQHILTGGSDGTLRLWDILRLPTVNAK